MSDVEKLEKEYEALLSEKISALKKEKEEQERLEAERKAKEYEEQLKIKVREELMKELNEKTKVEINTDGDTSKSIENPMVSFAKKYLNARKIKHVTYDELAMEFDASNTGCETDMSKVTPEGVYASLIFSAMYAKGKLAGKVTVRGLDVSQGEGGKVFIRTIGKRTAQEKLDACECLECVSTALDKHEITIYRYGDFTTLCDFDLYKAGDDLKAKIIDAMSNGLAEALDKEVWNALDSAKPTAGCGIKIEVSAPTDGKDACCMLAFNLYDAIIQAEANLRGAGYEPDYVVLHPTVSAYLKMRETAQKLFDVDIEDGKVVRISGLKVIETPVGVPASSASSGKAIAFVFDSSRAVGEAWGKRPKVEQERNIQCDSTDIAVHMYCGIALLDCKAVACLVVK